MLNFWCKNEVAIEKVTTSYKNFHKILSIYKTVYCLYLNYITKFRKLPLISKTDY